MLHVRIFAAITSLVLASLLLVSCGGGGSAPGSSSALGSDASLSNLSLSQATLSPNFQPGVFSYTVSVGFSIDTISITPTATDSKATIEVEGSVVASGNSSPAISLAVGDTTVTVIVTAEDSVTKATYTVTVTRASAGNASDATLVALTASTGRLSPQFDADTTLYKLAVNSSTTEVTVTPTAANAGATIKVDGALVASGSASQPISVAAYGSTFIDIDVTSSDGTSLVTYTVKVIKQTASGNDASLSALFLSTGELSPQFDSATTSYSVDVDQLATHVLVTAMPTDPNASVTVNGSSVNSNGGAVVALNIGLNNIAVQVTSGDGVATMDYSLAITRSNVTEFAQRAYLKADNRALNDSLGDSMAISGNTMIVGAPKKKNGSVSFAGAAFIFVRDPVTGIWTQQAYLKANNPDERDDFGISVAIDGDTAVVGAWAEDSAVPGDETDNSLTDAGAAYVFTRDASGNWKQQAYLKADHPKGGSGGVGAELFGVSVAISGDTIVVGANKTANSTGTSSIGRALVFTRSAGAWTQQAVLSPTVATDVSDFGISVAVQGDTAAIGASPAGTTVIGSGSVYIFTRSAGSWSQQAIIKADVQGENDFFGSKVALSPTPSQAGDYTLAVSTVFEDSSATGGPLDNSADKAGAAYVFTGSGSTWTQQAFLKASNAEADDQFGTSIDISGDNIIVGAIHEASSATGGEADNSAPKAGAAYVFTRSDGNWTQMAYLKASNADGTRLITLSNGTQLTVGGDRFGFSVAVENGIFAVGAPREASINGDPDDNSAGLVGAAYVWE